MDILKKTLLTALPVMALTGCYTDFNPDDYSEPVLCLNSVVTAGDTVKVSVGSSWRYNDPQGRFEIGEDDAEISVFVNGMLQKDPYIAAEGDSIGIRASSDRFGDAEAVVEVPHAVSIESVELIPREVRPWIREEEWFDEELMQRFDAGVRFNFQVRIRIPETRSAHDYFRLQYYSESSDSTYFSLGSLDFNSDPIFKEHIGIVESMLGGYDDLQLFFTDSMFSADGYTVTLNFDDAWFETFSKEYDDRLLDCAITFRLMTLSQSYYDRMNYLWQKNSGIIGDLSGLGLADPVWGYSNVSTGAGVVAAKAVSTYRFSLKDFLKDALPGVK